MGTYNPHPMPGSELPGKSTAGEGGRGWREARLKVRNWDRDGEWLPLTTTQLGVPLAPELSFAFLPQATELQYLDSNPCSVFRLSPGQVRCLLTYKGV